MEKHSSVPIQEQSKRMSDHEHLRHKIIYQWGIPVTIGVFSFLYWFLLVPLVGPLVPKKNWFVGPVAFFIWLPIVIPFLCLWHHKQKKLVYLPPPLKETVEYPSYPTKASAVQPVPEVKNSPCSRSQESSVWVPVQPGNVTPSLYNANTGRQSFQSGYQLDEMPEKSSVEEVKAMSRDNSGVQLVKKLDGENQSSSNHCLISVSSCSSSETGAISGDLDFKRSQRDPGDGLDAGESGGSECIDLQSKPQKAPLLRDESFQGLPDMQNFGEYLHLVTVDTPVSPRDAFFSDLGQSEGRKDDAECLRNNRKSYHPGGDLSDVQKRIADARKSLPPLFYYPDLEIGEARVLKITTLPPGTVLRMEDEQPQWPCYVRSVSEGRKHSWEAAKSRASGEFFVADASRLESITSEVQMDVKPDEAQVCQISRWETKQSSIAVSPSSAGDSSPKHIEVTVLPAEGRWVILSKDYASNNLEAFIRIEQEAMVRERGEARLASEDTDNDSVFFELDH